MGLLWHYSGTTLVLIWYYSGTGVVLLWYWCGTIMVLVWYYSGTGLVRTPQHTKVSTQDIGVGGCGWGWCGGVISVGCVAGHSHLHEILCLSHVPWCVLIRKEEIGGNSEVCSLQNSRTSLFFKDFCVLLASGGSCRWSH